MITYEFIVEPTPEQIRQIMNLYKTEGWWSIEDENYDVITGLIKGSHCFLAAIEQNQIIGMGRAISDKTSDAYIQDVTVADAYRKRGIGSEMLKRIISRLHEDGLWWIALIAEKDSHEFYRQLGFDQMPHSVPMLRKK